MPDPQIRKILKEVAREKGLSPTILEKAWMNQFRVVRDVVGDSVKNQEDTFKVVYLRYLGKFIPNRKGIRKMKDAAQRKADI